MRSTGSSPSIGGSSGTQTLNLNGRALTVRHAGIVAANGTLAIRSDGRLTVAGIAQFQVNGSLLFEQGTITSGGTVIIGPEATASLTTGSLKFIDGVLENQGTLTYSGTGLRFGRDAGNLTASIENAAGGVFMMKSKDRSS